MFQEKNQPSQQQIKHSSAWRWHFYAGLYVVPFMIMLSITGLVMLYDDVIEDAQYGAILNIEAQQTRISLEQQLSNVQLSYPDASIKQYITPENSERVARFAIVSASGQGLFVTINPYTGDILGKIDRDNSIYNWANGIHGTLLIGENGDRLIEIAASLMVILIVSGLYLWWPTDNASKAGLFKLRLSSGKRIFWRDLHANLGLVTSVFLLFFVISGLSWAGVWGEKIVQPWNSFPAEKWNNVPLSDKTHASMNHDVLEEVPWNLEQTKLPLSGSQMGIDAIPMGQVNLGSVVAYATQIGLTRFKVNIPTKADGVYTLSANTMSGDITDAREDRTLHIDQFSGKVLADIGWAEYSLMAKSMAAGIALHQGDMGLWNRILNTLLCLTFILIAVSGVIMWWTRRTSSDKWLAAPVKVAPSPRWLSAIIITSLLALMFPLAAGAIAFIWIMDKLLISRVAKFSYHLK
ncbi:PepSY-associated TM helix domain-containing protein [Psychromonas sp. Urea-02u-13]|uniref:PepSY-associated TM helix domain-containing protein n=1 Tax=Psychromonas sp. Urea-02u-13 TaxID=2058326 RepID=UPI000C31D91B|nr:PepSY domain-containing protein [Psychromonas sp. Urea-02u-13]PKG39817.1 hypothetical protein CXF74_06580 [Psychromonas sp. Urea-02u-13]